jgi:cytochrome c oxidase subunit 4
MKTPSILVVGVALLGLTSLTFALSHVPLEGAALPVALLIAATKASGIAWFYMHLSEQRGGSRLTVLAALSLIVVLISIVLLEAADRQSPSNAPGPFVVEP